MNMTLDERARQATRELNRAVMEADLLLFESGIPALRQQPVVVHHRSRALVFAGALAAVLLFVGLTLAPGRLTAPDNPQGEVATGEIAPDRVEPADATPGPDGTPVDDGPGTTLVASDFTPPAISVNSPEDGAEFSGNDFGGDVPLLEFSGTAEPDSTVVARTGVEPEPSVVVGDDGRWSIALILQAGTNPIRFEAVDAAGNATAATVAVTYTPDTAATTTTTAPTQEVPADQSGDSDPEAAQGAGSLTAMAAAGESTEEPPRDVFVGTARPGSKITLSSGYGSAETVAGADGEWSVELVFEGAPVDDPFLVTVTDEHGGRLKLEFVVRPPA